MSFEVSSELRTFKVKGLHPWSLAMLMLCGSIPHRDFFTPENSEVLVFY